MIDETPNRSAAEVFGQVPPPPPQLPPRQDILKGELAVRLSGSSLWLPLNEETMTRVHHNQPLNDDLKGLLANNRQKALEFLSKALQLPNLALFAGSGASLVEPRGPSMWDLWVRCLFTNGEYNSSIPAIEQFRKDAQAVCEKVRYTDLESPNIEHFLSACDAYLVVYPEDEEVKPFVSSCKAVILEACSEFLDDPQSDISAYTEMLRKLARRRTRDPRLKVFTTNYDMCFETASSDLGMMVVDGFSYTRRRRFDGQYFNFDVVNRASEEQAFIQGVIQLYKLHGSVSWERRGDGIFEVQHPSPDSACLIYPAKGKYQQAFIQPHLELLSRYLEFLRLPNACLVVSGFGFNDDHLSEPVLSAVKANPSLKLIVCDYAAREQIGGAGSHYWQKLASSGADVTFINASFKQLAELIPNLTALSPAEQLGNDVQRLLAGANR
ncbi:SIR2 family protein [Ferrimonas sp. SCSIO 43195]|uniref:SIR2 family protein n=1 Tax=Ferrimonas sp. SCSIO 43195 TaxID=2822844 RepID=UPI0020753B34|nr:SIR2 family protein [Ferrimonas sp. SCSIO 43195]USD35749.1 SIR2 family protein [Ferrimonas sp. SCSIO 43195]